MKKLLIVISAFLLVSGMVSAEITWKVEGGVLTISGEGDMPDYQEDYDHYAPWLYYWSGITTVIVEEGVTSLGNFAFYGYKYDWQQYVGNYKYYNTSIVGLKNATAFILPKSLKKIGKYAFRGCESLSSLTIPEGVEWIDGSVFGACVALKTVTINAENIILSGSFCNSPLNKVIFNCQSLKLEDCAFSGSNLSEFVVSNGTLVVGNKTFEKCKRLKYAYIPQDSELGSEIFYGCDSLETVEIHSKNIGNGTFNGCTSLKNLTIGEGVETIGINAFAGCKSLSELTLPKTLTSIALNAFQNCSGLQNLYIPSSVQNIADYAFQQCSSLKSVYCYSVAPPEIADNVFTGVKTKSARLVVPEGSQTTYRKADGWKEFGVIASTSGSEDVLVTRGSRDTLFVNIPYEVHDTTYIDVHDTTYVDVPYAVHDTTYIDVPYEVQIHDTTYVDKPYEVLIHDTTFVDVPYEVQIHDTTYVNVPYEVLVHDTTFVDVPYEVLVHDTTYVDKPYEVLVHDTTYIDVLVHDTTYIDVPYEVLIHDTTYIDVPYEVLLHDTTYVDVPYEVEIHDTTIVEMPLAYVDAPVISEENGMVSITCPNEDAVIYYTTDGTEPDLTSNVYTEPFEMEKSGVVMAIALVKSSIEAKYVVGTGMTNANESIVRTRYYDDSGVELLSPDAGVAVVVTEYESGRTVVSKTLIK